MKNKNNINILISIDDNYVSHAEDLIKSITDNNKDNCFNIFLIYNDTLSKESIEKLKKSIEENRKITLKPYYFEANSDKLPIYIDYISTVTYFRLFAPFIIKEDIDRLLYLDCDIICNGSIIDLYNIDLEGKIIGGCKNIIPQENKSWFQENVIDVLNLETIDSYINAGVLLIDIKKYKEYMTENGIYEYIQNNYDIIHFQDQDVINVLLKNKIKYFDTIYNYQINSIQGGYKLKDCKLIHYSESQKPWGKNYYLDRGINYYMFLFKHGRIKELKELLVTQYDDKVDEYLEIIARLNNRIAKIDIIIPVYNSLKTLHSALDSLVNQNFKDIKIYIIDDCSDDNYSSLLSEYSELDIFYYKLNNNRGPGYARQVGLDCSFGEYVIFLDSDDVFADENTVQILYESIQNSDVVTSVIMKETEDGYIKYANDELGLHGKMYRRYFIKNHNIRFIEARYSEDTYFNNLFRLYNARSANINKYTYLWKSNSESITRNNKSLKNTQLLLAYSDSMIKAYNEYANNSKIDVEIVKRYLADAIINIWDRYNIASESVKSQLHDNLNKVISLYYKYDTVDNLPFLITNEILRNIYYDYHDLILREFSKFPRCYRHFDEDKELKKYHIKLLEEYNNTSGLDEQKRDELLRKMFKNIEGYCIVEKPFHANWGGANVSIKSGYINYNCTMVDDGNINIGENVFIGPNVTICTSNHSINVEERINGIIYIQDINIYDNVWIGASVTILPGVTIGENSIIGAGSVVTEDIPANVIAVGNPCKVIKSIYD